jgi:membrane fusion protein (multidrug efflux system)
MGAALLLLPGCNDSVPAAGARSATTGTAVAVVTTMTQLQPFGTDLEAVGTARANESVDITAKVTNTIVRIGFTEGQQVQRGAVLVEFDPAQARAQLAEAQAALADSRRQFERSRDLAASQALSAAQLDQIGATLQANEARVAGARARVDDTVIRAPFNGRTGFRRVSVGSLVNPGTVITTLDDASPIKLEFSVPEAQLFQVEKGATATAATVGLPGEEFQGRITAVDARIDPVSRSILVRAELPNADGRLRPGMFMTVRLRGRVAPALLVPEAALVPEQGRMFVFVVDGDTVQQREVQIGRRRVGAVELVAGLREGERIVIEGMQNLRDGARVKIADAAAKSPS